MISFAALRLCLFKCPSCNYESRHLLGSPDKDQILTDVNTEFAEFKLFVCKKESKFVHMDVHDRTFQAVCPADGTELFPAVSSEDDSNNNNKDSGLPDKCPRCNQKITVEVTKPLASDSSAG